MFLYACLSLQGHAFLTMLHQHFLTKREVGEWAGLGALEEAKKTQIQLFDAEVGDLFRSAKPPLQGGVEQSQISQLLVCNALKLGKTSASHNELSVGDVVSATVVFEPDFKSGSISIIRPRTSTNEGTRFFRLHVLFFSSTLFSKTSRSIAPDHQQLAFTSEVVCCFGPVPYIMTCRFGRRLKMSAG